MLFGLDQTESVRRSSISERLSKINPDFFKQIYECVYSQFSDFYSASQRQKYNLIRFDSTMVCEASCKLFEGIDNKSKKAVKYSIAFDGILPCQSAIFTESEYGSEDIALPVVINEHIKQETGNNNICLIDRGLQSARNMKDFSRESINFIVRAKENRKHVEIENFITNNDYPEFTLVKDSKVYLYTGMPIITKKGTKRYEEQLCGRTFLFGCYTK